MFPRYCFLIKHAYRNVTCLNYRTKTVLSIDASRRQFCLLYSQSELTELQSKQILQKCSYNWTRIMLKDNKPPTSSATAIIDDNLKKIENTEEPSNPSTIGDVIGKLQKGNKEMKDDKTEQQTVKKRRRVDYSAEYLERNFITPVRAMSDFLLKPSDLENLPKTKRRSPYENEPPITVYWRRDVEAKAISIFGSKENFQKERIRREIERKKYQQNIFTVKRRLRDYRRELGRSVDDVMVDGGLRGRSGRVVLTAVAINGANCLFKLFAWLYTGSHSMFSECIHSLADTINQLILAFGIHKSVQIADSYHPYGYTNMKYVASLISGVGIFCVGTGLSFYHGISGILNPEPIDDYFWVISRLLSGIDHRWRYYSDPAMDFDQIKENLQTQLYELETLQSMFYNPGELRIEDATILEDIKDFLDNKTTIIPSFIDLTINLIVDDLKFEICINLSNEYPQIEPDLFVRNHKFNKKQHTDLNKELNDFLTSLDRGEPCIFTAITWLQDNVNRFITATETNCCETQPSNNDKLVRYWIYSHHIYSKTKRREILDQAKTLNITGFSMPGKPGIICIEGKSNDCNEWWQIIKSMNWKRIFCKITEECPQNEQTNFLKFDTFEEKVFQNASIKNNHMDMGELLKFLESHQCGYIFKDLFGVDAKSGT